MKKYIAPVTQLTEIEACLLIGVSGGTTAPNTIGD